MISDLVALVGEDRVRSVLGGALEQAARTKAAVDSNVESLLGLANVPSRSELLRLERKMDALQATVANLSRKVDSLADGTHVAPRRRRGATGQGATSGPSAETRHPNKS